MRVWLILGAALAVGCTDKGDTSSDEDDEGGGSGGGSGSGDLPAVFDDLDQELCEGVYDDVPGATSYFVGEFEKSGDTWSGTEWWVLFATDTWESYGGYDCTIGWIVSATEGDLESCAACDLHLDVAASLDPTITDCPEDLYKNEEQFEVGYEVALQGSDSTWYFAASGTAFATGSGSASSLAYVTEPQCDWF